MKKYLVILLSLVCVFLPSCGKSVKNVAPAELSRSVSEKRKLTCSEIGRDEEYRLWIDSETLEKYVVSAESYRDEIGTSGYELILIYTESEDSAQALRYEIERGHEWTPCDTAEKIIFANLGNTVLCVKGSEAETDVTFEDYCRAYGEKACKSSEKRNPEA